MSGLPISEELPRRLVNLVREKIDAFAATPPDLERISVIIHTIKTGDSKPFKHKLRPIPFAPRQYLEQEVEKLLEVGANFTADPGACPYALKTVFSPKGGTLRMCIDYRDLNAQIEGRVPSAENRPSMAFAGESEILRVTGSAHGLPPSGSE